MDEAKQRLRLADKALGETLIQGLTIELCALDGADHLTGDRVSLRCYAVDDAIELVVQSVARAASAGNCGSRNDEAIQSHLIDWSVDGLKSVAEIVHGRMVRA